MGTDLLEAFEHEVVVHLGPDESVHVPPIIHYSVAHTFSHFMDSGTIIDGAIRHEFTLRVDRLALKSRMDGETAAEDLWAKMSRYDLTSQVDSMVDRKVLYDDYLEIGQLSVREFSVRLKDAYYGSWFLLLDALDGDSARLGEVADELEREAEEKGELFLPDGSLFVPEMLAIHPGFRGSGLGIRLLAHGLWFLTRSMYDVALAWAVPTSNRFDTDEVDCSADSIKRLVSYYETAGLRRVRPNEEIVDNEAVAMVAYLGQDGLPVEGWW